ncbi:MAG: hypothetical protein V4668_03115 [Patescibacteria group bacterium]
MTRNYTIKIAKIILLVGVVTLLFAFFLRTNAVGSTFATTTGTGALELTIDNQTFYNGVLQPTMSWSLKNLVPATDKFFNFDDVKPGDTGTTTMSIHLKNSPAYVCLDFKNLIDAENGINEPESILDTNQQGELSGELEFFAWRDDGDNKFEVGEKSLFGFGTSSQTAKVLLGSTTYALADALNGPAYPVNQTKYIGITWCAGDLTVDIATAKISCDANAMGNEAQTDSMKIDVSIRAVSSTQQPKFTCNKAPAPLEQCEIEGHKYDEDGKPLANWTIGLMKVITHNKGVDTYDLATAVTDSKGYYCLNWDGEARTPRGIPTYKSGPYTFVYRVYEKLVPGWKNVSVEKGPDVNSLTVVNAGDIKKDGVYVSVQIGTQNGYIYSNAAYHVDFYNQLTKDTSKKIKKGNHGHGNEGDRNDNSNPGNSNLVSDTTDDDGLPGKAKITKIEERNVWNQKEFKTSPLYTLKTKVNQFLGMMSKSNQT